MLKIKKIKPMFTALVTTMDLYESTSGIDAYKQGTIKEVQTVVSVGPNVSQIKVGDLVSVNPTRFAKRKNNSNSIQNDIEGGNPILKYEFDILEINDKPHLLLQDRDINYVIEEYEEVEDKPVSGIIMPSKDIIS